MGAVLSGEDGLDDEMYDRAPCWAVRTTSMMRCIIERALAQAPCSKRKGCTKARPLLPSAWTQPHVPPLPTHDSPHDSFEDVLRRESAIYARAHPLRTACDACASHGAPSCRGTKHRLMAPNTAPSAVEPSIVSRRPTRRPQPSNQASSHGAQHGALSRRTKHRLPPRLCLQCLVDRLRRFIPQRSTSRRFHERAVHLRREMSSNLTSVNSQRLCPPQRLEPVGASPMWRSSHSIVFEPPGAAGRTHPPVNRPTRL